MAVSPADPVARRSASLFGFFGGVMARAMRRGFRAVRVARPGVPALPPGRPAVLYTNHPSWWDAALIIVLAHRCFPERASFGPIAAAQLRRYPFMARIGLYGADGSTRQGAAEFLRTGAAILADPRAALWITPEGAFTDARVRPVRLRRGLAHLARRAPAAVLVPVAFEYPFWDERAPEALVRFGAPFPASELAGRTPALATALLEQRLEACMDGLAASALARDPAAFEPLLQGRVGVGGVYELWQRGRALLAGQRFSPAHGQAEPPAP